jgi:hypothetical protein
MTIARGGHHSLFIKDEGSLWAMGWNQDGQLGTGDTIDRTTPVRVLEPVPAPIGFYYLPTNNVLGVVAGNWHSLYLKSDGSLFGMGKNECGQLGQGNTTASSYPVQIQSTGVSAVAAAASHSFFIKSDGSFWGMGDNLLDQLGVPGQTSYNTPQQISVNGVVAIDANEKHTLILKTDGSMAGVGDNDYSQLGTGDTVEPTTFTQIVSGVGRLSETSSPATAAPMVTTDSASELSGRLVEFNFPDEDGTGTGQQVDVYFDPSGTLFGGFAGRVTWKEDEWLYLRDGNSIGRAIFGDAASGERFEIEMYFSSATEGHFWAYDYETWGSLFFREFEDHGTFKLGTGTLTIDPNWEFSDDFSGSVIDTDLWSLEKDDPRHEIVQSDGRLNFILDEQAEELYVDAEASRILPLDEDWTVQAKVFADAALGSGNWYQTGIDLETYNETHDEREIGIQLTQQGVRALIPDHDDWSNTIESGYDEYGAEEAYLRIRHVASARTLYLEYELDGDTNGWDWDTLMTFNMETGAGTNASGQTFQTTSWGAMGQPSEYMNLEIEAYTDDVGTQAGQLGFDEIIVAKGSSAANEGLIPGPTSFVGIVKTDAVTGIGSSSATATATLLADGGSSVTGNGFQVSEDYSFTYCTEFASPQRSLGSYNVTLTGLKAGTRYYCRAYVDNAKGRNYGAKKRFQTTVSSNNPWKGATSLGSGWFDVHWLGPIYQATGGWFYHQDHGWFYATADASGNGVWSWTSGTGWLWTSPQAYPYFWEHDDKSWIYFLKRKGSLRVFYSQKTRAWVEK